MTEPMPAKKTSTKSNRSNTASSKNGLSAKERGALLSVLRTRFEDNMQRHESVDWEDVEARLDAKPDELSSLGRMEATGGEPDVVGYDKKTGEFIFYDCSVETPAGRRNLCYDGEAQRSRKGPVQAEGNVIDAAAEIGIDVLTEDEYRALQQLGEFDLKTSSWIKTPPDIRKAGGALFADRRYGHVFVYHNGAQSFYGARAFRGSLRV